MTYSTVVPIWSALRDRFQGTVEALPEQDLQLVIGTTKVSDLLYHTAEVEFMFADWFFGKEQPAEFMASEERNLASLVALLAASNTHLLGAMEALPEDQWQQVVKSPMGDSTPLEAVGRLMYHTGMHAGQISLIRKNGEAEV